MRFSRHLRLRVLGRAVAYRNTRVHAGSLGDFTPAATRSGDAGPITRACERRHEHPVMRQIPVELGQGARFSPNRRPSSSPFYPLSTTTSVAYTSWHVWSGKCTSSLWNGDRI
jgi:hypothetical protein